MGTVGKNMLEEATNAFGRGDYLAAKEMSETLAATGSKQALLLLGAIYERGNADIPKDFTKARYWYERAFTEAHLSMAALQLGHYYWLGLGVPVDYTRAFSYYSTLEHSEDAIALLRLGIHYESGRGVHRNVEKALGYYRRAAKLGNIFARTRWGFVEMKRGHIFYGLLLWGWATVHSMSLALISGDSKRLRT